MQAKVKESSSGFKPIKIELVIESEQELCDLWHRLNVSTGELGAEGLVYGASCSASDELFTIIDSEVCNLGLYSEDLF